MKRKPFSQILQDASIDFVAEYGRLIQLFTQKRYFNAASEKVSLLELCEANFINLPYRGTCISLSDFNKTHRFNFTTNSVLLTQYKSDFVLNYLVTFCEYSYNLAVYSQNVFCTSYQNGNLQVSSDMQLYVNHVLTVIDKIGYMPNCVGLTTDFVPKDQVAISVAEVIDSTLSYRVIEYNHHSMKGDLAEKKNVLLALAEKLEPQESKLREINNSLGKAVFGLLNNVNIRHNNVDPNGGKDYNAIVAGLSEEELEHWYDETYQLCLLAFLELDNIDRKKQAADFLKQL